MVSLLLAGGANTEATDEVRKREMGSGNNDTLPGGRPKMVEFHLFRLRNIVSYRVCGGIHALG